MTPNNGLTRSLVAGAALLMVSMPCGVRAQQFAPGQNDLLFQPSPVGGQNAGTFDHLDARPSNSTAGKTNSAKTAPNSKAPISSELTGSAIDSKPAPSLAHSDTPGAAQQSPKIPFGGLSLGLQAGANPKSNDLYAAELPSGMSQFKKDRTDPYVGLSIIDIKR